MKGAKRLWISMNGLLVGELVKKKAGILQFRYVDEWLNSPFSRSLSLSLPLSKKVYEGDVLFNFLDNLLPDNEMIRAKMQARFQTSTLQPFDLLSAVGRDCVGAIQLSFEREAPWKEMDAKLLSEPEVASLLRGYASAPLGMLDEEDDFRISIAGAQEKTALLKIDAQWFLPRNATPTTHILKLPIGRLAHHNLDLSQSCENEWLCMEIARAFGLPVANAEILVFEDQKVLAVERFDRKWLSAERLIRLPQEDMCQALGIAPALKYESDGGPSIQAVMAILQGSQNAKEDRETFFKAQILFWLLAAPDGHGKNFSLFIGSNNGYRLTPLYDILSAYPFMGGAGVQKQKVKMAMALQGETRHFRWDAITPRHFLLTAKAVGYSETLAFEHFKEMMLKAEEVIEFASEVLPENFPKKISDPILKGLRKKSQLGLGYIQACS